MVGAREARRTSNSRPDPIMAALAEMQATRQADLELQRQANQEMMDVNREAVWKAIEDVLEANIVANTTVIRILLEEMRDGMARECQPPQPPPPPPPPPPQPIFPEGGDGNGGHEGQGGADRTLEDEASHFVSGTQPCVERVGDHEARHRLLNDFWKHSPPSFDGSFDPIVAAKWLQSLGRIFSVMECQDHQKLLYATYMLVGDASEWWISTSQAYKMLGQMVTWPLFEGLFLDRYFPYDARERKQGKFEQLTQGTISVDEYLAKFNELVRYANYRMVMPTPDYLATKFRQDLNEKIAKRLASSGSRDFGTLVNQCRDIENVCGTNRPKVAKKTEVRGAGSSTPWRDKRAEQKRKGKGVQARQQFGKFRRVGSQAIATSKVVAPPRCASCGREH